MNIEASKPRLFFLLHHQRIRLGVGVLPHPGHLPGNFNVGRARPDLELVVFDLASDDGLRELSDHGQLVAEVGVEYLEPFWQSHCRVTLAIGGDVAVVDVLHLGGFD